MKLEVLVEQDGDRYVAKLTAGGLPMHSVTGYSKKGAIAALEVVCEADLDRARAAYFLARSSAMVINGVEQDAAAIVFEADEAS